MYLFNPIDFAARFGIDMTVPDFSNAVNEASRASTRAIASRFRFQDFDSYATRRDVFQIDRMLGAGNLQNRELLLSRGFINPTVGFSAVYTSNPVHARNNDATLVTNLQRTQEDSQSDYLFIDAEKGKLTAYSVDLTDQWVVVTYSCGLSVASDGVYEGVPGWLQEAAEAQTALFLKQSNIFQTEEAEDLTSLRQNLFDLQAAHARLFLSAVGVTMTDMVT